MIYSTVQVGIVMEILNEIKKIIILDIMVIISMACSSTSTITMLARYLLWSCVPLCVSVSV